MNRTRNAGNKENDHKIGNNKGEIINKLVPLNKQPPQQEYRDVYLRNNKDVKLPTITTLQLKVNPV
jgi:5-formyltetrahydrofolate cyclo-ligase